MYTNSNIAVVWWFENGTVHLVSNFIISQFGITVKRWRGKRKSADVDCPLIVNQYNKQMDGDEPWLMLISLGWIQLGTKKLYMRIIYHALGLSILNDWLIYKQCAKQNGMLKKNTLPLLGFLLRLSQSLLQRQIPRKIGRTSTSKTPPPERKIATEPL